MTQSIRRALCWAPHILAIVFTLFISLFALDVFDNTQGFWGTLRALFLHMIPSFVLAAMVILAWKREWIGAFLSAGLAALFLWWNFSYRHNVATAVIAIAGPLCLMAALYLLAWVKRHELRP